MSNYKIIKLDRRYNGFGMYEYMIEPSWADLRTNRQAKFLSWREWLWSMFGPGCELEMIQHMDTKPKWAWATEFNNMRLYIDDESLVIFKLKF